MNKLIEQLTIEAFFDEATNGSGQKMYTFGEEKMQKFAELIVRECANIANSGIDPAESHLIGDDILEHFSIEE